MRHHCLLLRRNNLHQTIDTFLTEKWMFTCHLVISGPSHQDQELRMIVPSPLGEDTVTQSFCLLQEPQPQHPTCHLQMSPSAGLKHQGHFGAPSSQNLTFIMLLRELIVIFDPREEIWDSLLSCSFRKLFSMFFFFFTEALSHGLHFC